MISLDITPEKVRIVFKGKKVIIIGNSICRSIYKDFACLLNGHDRLLKYDELRFNRRYCDNEILHGGIIIILKTDRSNSINNIEKRSLVSNEHDYLLCYSESRRPGGGGGCAYQLIVFFFQ